MNVKQLKRGLAGFMTGIFFSALLIACEDNKSGNNSTGSGSETDTVSKATDTKAVVKRKGKASARINADDPAVKIEKDKMGIYTRTDIAPVYGSGQQSVEDYVNNTIEYPQDAIDNNIEGIVNVQFAVDENGKITNVSTLGQKLGYGLEEEAIRVVSAMPEWTPGKVKGKNVKTWRMLPINYRLES